MAMSPATEEAAILHHDLQAVKRCRTRPCNSASYPSCHQVLPPISLFSNVIWNSYARTGMQAQVYNRECQAAMAQERPRGATPRLRPGAVAERSNATSKERRLRGCRRVERSNATFRSGGCVGTGGLRGATPRSRSGEATSSKVRSSGWALLQQP